MCLTCPKHMAKGQNIGLRASTTGKWGKGKGHVLFQQTRSPGTVGCSICGGAHSPQSHAGMEARKLPALSNLGKGYPGSLAMGAARKVHGLGGGGKKLRLGK